MHHTLKKLLVMLLLLPCLFRAGGQTNCSVFTDSAHSNACRIYKLAIMFPQGSRPCMQLLDSATRVCPDYAEAWHELSVPYLKRGDFFTWRQYLDRAVELKPRQYLLNRGWCRFKFLRDYAGALTDLKKLDTISSFYPGTSGDGYYNIYIVMALCARELGNYTEAFHYFKLGIDSVVAQNGEGWVGFYDYLHRAVAKMRVRDYAGALTDLDKQISKHDRFAEIWYYRGLILAATNRKKEARTSFQKAKTLYLLSGNNHFTDVYTEMLDQVFLTDMENALKNADLSGAH